jgi:hypothetical protein
VKSVRCIAVTRGTGTHGDCVAEHSSAFLVYATSLLQEIFVYARTTFSTHN